MEQFLSGICRCCYFKVFHSSDCSFTFSSVYHHLPSLLFALHSHSLHPNPPIPHPGSIPCFALATYNFGPGAVWAYGVLLDEDTRDVLESEGSGVDDQGLSVYVRMTRYDGRGLMALLAGGGGAGAVA